MSRSRATIEATSGLTLTEYARRGFFELLRTVDDEVRLIALRAIEIGEEVTIDYLINTHGGSSWTCRCGSDRCRGRLETSFFDLPAGFQREYLPLLEDWFVEEHPEEIQRLKRRLATRA